MYFWITATTYMDIHFCELYYYYYYEVVLCFLIKVSAFQSTSKRPFVRLSYTPFWLKIICYAKGVMHIFIESACTSSSIFYFKKEDEEEKKEGQYFPLYMYFKITRSIDT